MNQVYDPLAYVSQTGAAVSRIGRNVAGTLSQFFQDNAQWKQLKTNEKTDDAAKNKFFNYTMQTLQEKGIDPSTIPELETLKVSLGDKRVSPEAFAEITAKALEPHQEKLLLKAEINKFDPNLEMQDPMSKIQGIDTAPRTEAGPIAMYPAKEISELTQVPTEESPTKKYQKRMVDYYSNLADKGMLKAGDATKFYDIMAKLEHDENQANLTEKKAKIKKEEEDRKELREKAADDLRGARISNLKIVDKNTGKEIDYNPYEGRLDPSGYSISKEHEQWKPSGGGGGSGGSPKNPDELKLQKAIIERLRQMNAGDFDMVQREDAMGNKIPTYIPKPNSKSAQILNNADWYNEFAITYFPGYAKSLGITAPGGTTRGAGF